MAPGLKVSSNSKLRSSSSRTRISIAAPASALSTRPLENARNSPSFRSEPGLAGHAHDGKRWQVQTGGIVLGQTSRIEYTSEQCRAKQGRVARRQRCSLLVFDHPLHGLVDGVERLLRRQVVVVG